VRSTEWVSPGRWLPFGDDPCCACSPARSQWDPHTRRSVPASPFGSLLFVPLSPPRFSVSPVAQTFPRGPYTTNEGVVRFSPEAIIRRASGHAEDPDSTVTSVPAAVAVSVDRWATPLPPEGRTELARPIDVARPVSAARRRLRPHRLETLRAGETPGRRVSVRPRRGSRHDSSDVGVVQRRRPSRGDPRVGVSVVRRVGPRRSVRGARGRTGCSASVPRVRRAPTPTRVHARDLFVDTRSSPRVGRRDASLPPTIRGCGARYVVEHVETGATWATHRESNEHERASAIGGERAPRDDAGPPGPTRSRRSTPGRRRPDR
jgi:hypothetical protein